MASFDWLAFLRTYRIEYVDRGPNVARGNVNIQCPFCGSADTSHHMGISTRGAGWGCWRSKSHRGRAPHRLIKALLRCSDAEAARIAGEDAPIDLEDDARMLDYVRSMVEPAAFSGVEPIPDWPREFKPLTDRGLGRLFFSYMMSRGYSTDEVDEISTIYDLRYCTQGPFAYRIVIPVYMERGLVNWTGRAIADNATIRYRTLSADPERAREHQLPCAPLSIEKTLWNYQALCGVYGEALAIVEGPMDALRIDYYGNEMGIWSTCIFGTGNLSPDQIFLLSNIRNRFKHVYLTLDNDAQLVQIQMSEELAGLDITPRAVPPGIKDPAMLSPRDIRHLYLDYP
jgi:hypothetical protein